MPALTLFWIALALMAVLFGCVWAVCARIGNYGFLDALWSLSVALLAPCYAWLAGGAPTRRVLFAAIGTLWSLRLGLHVLVRVWRHHPTEDARYETLRKRWPGPARFLLFFELQAFVAVVFSLPFLLASVDPAPSVSAIQWAGLGLALLATAGEAIADRQAERFKHSTANRERVLDTGLWRYSRHPNYFFESLVWWGFFIAAVPSPHGWITVVCPLLMLFFLLRVTGIPLTEAHSLRHRGEAYRRYQQVTSRFIPLPRKAAPRSTD
jgi:steroid 5-alpha reductase family enzyme